MSLLEIETLQVAFDADPAPLQAVRGVSLTLAAGETLALVGESGAGKSALCKALLRLLPAKGRVTDGCIRFEGRELTTLSAGEMRRLRGGGIALMPQDPAGSLDPARTIGGQVAEVVRLHIDRRSVDEKVCQLLTRAGLEEPAARMRQYPHQLSGGQRQRVALAMALAGEPRLLVADEPTTALDAVLAAQVLELLAQVKAETGAAVLLVTHDLLVAARAADRVAVMYAGKIVETGTPREVFGDPRHPYTWGLLGAHPAFARSGQPLAAIAGGPPDLRFPPQGDAFAPRNPWALAIDYEQEPPFFHVGGEHFAASWLCDPRAPAIDPPVRLATEFFAEGEQNGTSGA